MLLYELTRLVEEGRNMKDASNGMPEKDLQPRTPSTSEIELLIASLRSEMLKKALVRV